MRVEIIPIIAPCLYTAMYTDPKTGVLYSEYDRLMKLWMNPEYWHEMAFTFGIHDTKKRLKFVKDKLREADKMDEQLLQLAESSCELVGFFEPLSSMERVMRGIAREKRRGSLYKGLRLYALRVVPSTYVITGGALKLTQTMQDAPETKKELDKMNSVRSFLHENDVEDDDSFYDWLIEIED